MPAPDTNPRKWNENAFFSGISTQKTPLPVSPIIAPSIRALKTPLSCLNPASAKISQGHHIKFGLPSPPKPDCLTFWKISNSIPSHFLALVIAGLLPAQEAPYNVSPPRL